MLDHVRAAIKVTVESALCDACGLRDFLDRDALDSLLEEESQTSLGDSSRLLATVLFAFPTRLAGSQIWAVISFA
ncbi:MAG: hypothetical protein ACJAYU_002349 [Bradymonadia bacterium]|jgi:hypothetical protein